MPPRQVKIGTAAKWNNDAHQARYGALMNVLEANNIAYCANSKVVKESMNDCGYESLWKGIQ